MEDQVKALIRKGQGLAHVGTDKLDVIAFPPRHQLLLAQLLLGIVQHRALCSQGCKDRDLLPAAAGKTENLCPLHRAEPLFGHRLCRGQQHRPVALFGAQIGLVADLLSPFPTVAYPLVDGGGVDIGVVFGHDCSLLIYS